MAGKQGQCPACQAVLTIPTGKEPTGTDPSDAPSADEVQPSTPPEQTRICPACGERIKAIARKCRFCGEILDPSLLSARKAFGHGEPVPLPHGGRRSNTPAPTSGMAIASLILGISGFFTCGFTSIIGVILGHLALKQIREGKADGSAMATAGLVLSYIMLAFFSLGLGGAIFG